MSDNKRGFYAGTGTALPTKEKKNLLQRMVQNLNEFSVSTTSDSKQIPINEVAKAANNGNSANFNPSHNDGKNLQASDAGKEVASTNEEKPPIKMFTQEEVDKMSKEQLGRFFKILLRAGNLTELNNMREQLALPQHSRVEFRNLDSVDSKDLDGILEVMQAQQYILYFGQIKKDQAGSLRRVINFNKPGTKLIYDVSPKDLTNRVPRLHNDFMTMLRADCAKMTGPELHDYFQYLNESGHQNFPKIDTDIESRKNFQNQEWGSIISNYYETAMFSLLEESLITTSDDVVERFKLLTQAEIIIGGPLVSVDKKLAWAELLEPVLKEFIKLTKDLEPTKQVNTMQGLALDIKDKFYQTPLDMFKPIALTDDEKRKIKMEAEEVIEAMKIPDTLFNENDPTDPKPGGGKPSNEEEAVKHAEETPETMKADLSTEGDKNTLELEVVPESTPGDDAKNATGNADGMTSFNQPRNEPIKVNIEAAPIVQVVEGNELAEGKNVGHSVVYVAPATVINIDPSQITIDSQWEKLVQKPSDSAEMKTLKNLLWGMKFQRDGEKDMPEELKNAPSREEIRRQRTA